MTHQEHAASNPAHQSIIDLHRAGRIEEADAACRALLEERANDPDLLALAAAGRQRLGDMGEAEAMLRRALEHAPGYPAAWRNLGQFLEQAGRWDEARTHYEESVGKFPTAPRLRESLGKVYQRAGDFAAAEAAYRRLIELAPRYAGAWMRLGMTLLRQDRLDDSVAAFTASIDLNPDLAAAHGNLGNAHQKRGDLAAARESYARAVELNPNDAQSFVSLGLVSLRLGDAQAAADIFDRCLATMGPERRAAAWLPFARAQSWGELPGGYRAELGRLIHRASLDPPDGFETVAGFNRALADALCAEQSVWEPAGKATRGGAQTGLLLDAPREPYLSFERALRRKIDAHFDSLVCEKGHPFLGQVPRDYQLDIWGTLLSEGGHQHPHIHVGGWMSGVYYVELPETVGHGPDSDKAGWIEFGRPPPDFQPAFEPKTLTFEPREGDAFFFPSYVFHQTLPFTGDKPRISLAFDVKPTSWR